MTTLAASVILLTFSTTVVRLVNSPMLWGWSLPDLFSVDLCDRLSMFYSSADMAAYFHLCVINVSV